MEERIFQSTFMPAIWGFSRVGRSPHLVRKTSRPEIEAGRVGWKLIKKNLLISRNEYANKRWQINSKIIYFILKYKPFYKQTVIIRKNKSLNFRKHVPCGKDGLGSTTESLTPKPMHPTITKRIPCEDPNDRETRKSVYGDTKTKLRWGEKWAAIL